MAATFCFILVISTLALLPSLEATCFEVGGAITLAFTPIADDNQLCLECIPPYAQFLKDKDVRGVVVLSITGEGQSLNLNDSKAVLDVWMRAATPLDLYVIASVGGAAPLSDVIELAKYSENIGVAAVMAQPMFDCQFLTAADLLYNMEPIAKAAINTPFIFNDERRCTDTCGNTVDMVEFFELATNKICNFRGLKSDVLETLLALQPIISEGQKLFVANTKLLLPEVLVGFENYMLDVLNVFPTLVINIIKTGQSCRSGGKRALSISLYQRLMKLYDAIIRSGKRIAAMKETMSIVNNIRLGTTICPFLRLTEEEKYTLREELSENGYTITNTYCDD